VCSSQAGSRERQDQSVRLGQVQRALHGRSRRTLVAHIPGIVRSREPAHPAIVTVEMFTAVQLEQRKRRRGGRRGWSSMERTRQTGKRVYMLRSRIRSGICARKMEGATRRQVVTYYRCNARTLVPGSATALAHPSQIYLREDLITPSINRWIGRLFGPLHREATINKLIAADETAERQLGRVRELQDRIAAAEEAMARLHRALDAGWDPVELREQYNLAVAEKRNAEAALAVVPHEPGVSRRELEAIIDGLGDMAQALDRAEPEHLAELYSALRLSLTYHHAEQVVDVEVDPLADRVDKLRVRGGTRTLTTRLTFNV